MPLSPRLSTAIFTLIGFLSNACVGFTPPAQTGTIEPKNYGAAFDIGQSVHHPTVESREENLAPQVSHFLGTNKKIAILPPDQCEKKAMTEGASSSLVDIARTDCGNFMSTLEIELARQGYTVISWQRLRTGRSVADSFEAAKNLGADVVVEIDQLSIGTPTNNSRTIANIAFSEWNADGSGQKPVLISSDTQKKCLDLGENIGKSMGNYGTEAVMAAKAVDLKTGTAVWYYSHSEFVDTSEEHKTTELRIFPVQGTATAPTYEYQPGGQNGLQKAGTWTFLGGMLITGAGVLIPLAGDNPVRVNAPIVLGSIGMVTGIVLAIIGNAKMRSYERKLATEMPPVTYPAADSVMCTGPGVTPTAPAATSATTYQQPPAAVQSVTTVTHTKYEPERKAIEQLTNHFANAIKRASTSP